VQRYRRELDEYIDGRSCLTLLATKKKKRVGETLTDKDDDP